MVIKLCQFYTNFAKVIKRSENEEKYVISSSRRLLEIMFDFKLCTANLPFSVYFLYQELPIQSFRALLNFDRLPFGLAADSAVKQQES